MFILNNYEYNNFDTFNPLHISRSHIPFLLSKQAYPTFLINIFLRTDYTTF